MLIYHFGSREGLLAAVVETVEQGERDLLARLLLDEDDPYAAGLRFWEHVADSATTFAPLYFELAGHAMQGRPWAAGLRDWLTDGWTDALTDLWTRLGRPREEAAELARVNLAAVRGLLFDLALTGDRAAADAGMRLLGERFGLDRAAGNTAAAADVALRTRTTEPGGSTRDHRPGRPAHAARRGA